MLRSLARSADPRFLLSFGLLTFGLLMVAGPVAASAAIAGALLGYGAVRRPATDDDKTSLAPSAPAIKALATMTAAAPSAAPAHERAAPTATPWPALLDALPDPALAIDRERAVVHANQAAHDLFPSLRRGGTIALASRNPALAEAVQRALDRGERRTVQLHERIPVERRLDVALAPLPAIGAGEPAALIVLRDVSERERLAQMRADFIANASHELRTPLAALRGFVETLQGPAKEDVKARDRFLTIMANESSRMTRLLDDLLSLSRVEMRAHIPPTDHVDLRDIIDDVMATMTQIADAAGVTLKLLAQPEVAEVRGDHDELVQVFANLVQNAIKYGRRGGSVEVTMREVGLGERRWVRVAVVDNGPGISEEHLPRLTERFYRVDDKSSREKGGTGLGLAIVKHILNRHGGELRIASKLGVGSTFTVDLPIANGNSKL
ncbi:MAG: ATP-binding protein [Hyphomicrobiaceae bacterium]|nr:ATP-binding protein [Hyphomicrobiaceae bacterium]